MNYYRCIYKTSAGIRDWPICADTFAKAVELLVERRGISEDDIITVIREE